MIRILCNGRYRVISSSSESNIFHRCGTTLPLKFGRTGCEVGYEERIYTKVKSRLIDPHFSKGFDLLDSYLRN